MIGLSRLGRYIVELIVDVAADVSVQRSTVEELRRVLAELQQLRPPVRLLLTSQSVAAIGAGTLIAVIGAERERFQSVRRVAILCEPEGSSEVTQLSPSLVTAVGANNVRFFAFSERAAALAWLGAEYERVSGRPSFADTPDLWLSDASHSRSQLRNDQLQVQPADGRAEPVTFRHSKDLIGVFLGASDGDLGRCVDLLFDDHHWTVRYLVVDTGQWLPGRKVLVSPISIEPQLSTAKKLSVNIPKATLEAGPELDEHAPVARQYEQRYARHMGYGYYWGGELPWGPVTRPWELAGSIAPDVAESSADPHLRSAGEVSGYEIHVLDGQLGTLDSYVLDGATWTIRYLVVDSGSWLRGRLVLIAPDWVKEISWGEHCIKVDMTRETIKNSPELRPELLDRECENILYDYYGRPRYWEHTEVHTA